MEREPAEAERVKRSGGFKMFFAFCVLRARGEVVKYELAGTRTSTAYLYGLRLIKPGIHDNSRPSSIISRD